MLFDASLHAQFVTRTSLMCYCFKPVNLLSTKTFPLPEKYASCEIIKLYKNIVFIHYLSSWKGYYFVHLNRHPEVHIKRKESLFTQGTRRKHTAHLKALAIFLWEDLDAHWEVTQHVTSYSCTSFSLGSPLIMGGWRFTSTLHTVRILSIVVKFPSPGRLTKLMAAQSEIP